MEQEESKINYFPYGEKGDEFISNIRYMLQSINPNDVEDFQWILSPLTELSIPEGYVLDTYHYGDSTASILRLYVRKKETSGVYIPYDDPEIGRKKEDSLFFKNEEVKDVHPNPYSDSLEIRGRLGYYAGKQIPEIWDYISVPFTPSGLWQAALLQQTPALLPKVWHALYNSSSYVFCDYDIEAIYNSYEDRLAPDEVQKFAVILENQEMVFPRITINNDEASVSFVYWNDWNGLGRKTIHITRKGDFITFGEDDYENYVKYKSSIRF